MNEYAGLSASSESLGLSTGRQQGQRSTTVWLCCQSQVCTFSPSQLIQQMVRVCVCVCEGQRCRFIPYAWMYTRTCAVICPSACYYCHMIKILFLHAYSECAHLCYISTFNFPSACIINRCGVRRIPLGSLWSHSLPNALLFDTGWYTDEGE